MSEFERIVNDAMVAYNAYDPNDEGLELDPIMGDDDWIDTDDEWLDDFQGEEDWA
jgi:hypothetical protein